MLSFLFGTEELAGRIRSHDWTATPLGSLCDWPDALKTLVNVMLGSKQPMFIVWEAEQTLLYNDGYAEILGRKHPAALGRPFLDVWSEIANDLRPIVEQAYRGNAIHMDHIALTIERRGEPEEAHFAFSYTPIRHEGGTIDGFFCACMETTKQVLAVRATLESEARNRQIFNSATDYGIVASNLQGRITDWNEGARRIFGWTADEIVGEFADRLFTPEDLAIDQPQTEMLGALETGRSADERWHIRKDGERFWASGEMTPLLTANGEAAGFVKVLRDRTEQRIAHEALRASEAALAEANKRLEASFAATIAERDHLWEASPDLLVVLDFEGRLQEVNPAWTKLLGFEREELIGRHVESLVCPEDVGMTHQALEEATGGPLPVTENRYFHKDGSVRWFQWVAAPKGGSIYATGRHITAERAAQDALRHTEEQLRQSQKVEAVGQLTGGVAHDFNNLLTVIRGSVDLLRRSDLSEERRRRYTDAIADTADRATRLTSQLLAFARRQALKPETFDAGESLRAIKAMVQTLAGSRIRIVTDVASCPCAVHVDRSQFDTAIVNMAVNARDAMDGEGELGIRIGSASCIPAVRSHPAVAGEFITISISDTGVGIAPDQIDRIFEPFFTTKDVGAGTGLGLSQVFGFAKQSGGDVTVTSELGQGSTFTLYLPQADRLAGEPATAAAQEAAGLGEGACVLVVEDNADVGAFAAEALAELGYQTCLAVDGASALAELSANRASFDVVFTDVVMPGMSGIELGQRIREAYADLPVILTSGYSTVLAQNGDHGFELLRKPYSVDELSRVLRKVSSWRRSKS